MNGFSIGKLAKACGLKVETLRFYERIGLIKSEGRKANGYRVFMPDSLKRLQFIQRAKLLNFTLEEIKDLLLVRGSPKANCEDIYSRLQTKIDEVDDKIKELSSFKKQLRSIASHCPRGTAPLKDCSLMDFLDKPEPDCKAMSKPNKKQNFKKSLILAFLFLMPLSAQAKPIPYTGGWMVMQENNTKENLFHAVYGLSPDYSAGISSVWNKDKGYWLHSGQLNYLAARQNFPDAQMNVFLMSGLGAALKNDVAHPAGWAGILADYETRRLFFSYDNNITYANTIETSFSQKARVGVAPYIGDYDDLHTWLMFQVEHYPNTNHEFVATPLIRLFKDNYLFEVGYSSNHKILFNWNITL
ncbi:MAG: heavy metal-responsive transcriptional regulator [Alphaproteobacteria bacterium]